MSPATVAQTTRDETTEHGHESPAITWLARFGAFFVAVQIYVYARWITSDHFKAADSGPDKVPHSTLIWIRSSEAVCIIGSVVFIVWIIYKTRKDRAVPTLGVFVIAWLLAAWQDPGVNALRPIFAYNTEFFNRGTWGEFIPGWVAKGPETPQPIWYTIGNYFVFMPASVLGIRAGIDAMRRKFPRLSKAQVMAVMLVFFIILDVLMEQYLAKQGMWGYLRVNGDWSISTATMWQFPVYEGVVFGGIISVISLSVYCFRTKNDMFVSDIGIERLKIKRGVGLVRILALAAIFNFAMLAFNLGYNFVNQHADTQPKDDIPSYLHHDMCGIKPNPPCSGPK